MADLPPQGVSKLRLDLSERCALIQLLGKPLWPEQKDLRAELRPGGGGGLELCGSESPCSSSLMGPQTSSLKLQLLIRIICIIKPHDSGLQRASEKRFHLPCCIIWLLCYSPPASVALEMGHASDGMLNMGLGPPSIENCLRSLAGGSCSVT